MMKTKKIKSAMFAVATCSLVGLSPLVQVASAEVTPPVGYVKLTFNAESDTPFSLPLNRPKAYNGEASAISGNTISIANTDFTAGEYVYADGTQNEKYYVLFTTGVLEGRTFDVTANATDSITVDQSGDTDVATLGAVATDGFEIRPHWTLNTLFPNGENFDKSTDPFSPSGLIMVRSETDAGEFVPVSTTYLYYDSTNNSDDGWYDANNLGAGKVDDKIMKQTVFYVCKNTSTTETHTVNLVGDVPLVDRKVSLRLNADGIKQGNYVSLTFPVEMSLAESGLSSASGFKKTTDPFNIDGDRVLKYDDIITTYNPAPSAVYIYFDSSTNSDDGWYDANDLAAGKQDAAKIFKPGKGYIISKQDDFEEIFQWNIQIPYNPFTEN